MFRLGNWKAQTDRAGNNFPTLFSYVTQGLFNLHGWFAPHIFPFLKLVQMSHWHKWVFILFLGDSGSFHHIFYQHPGYAVLYIVLPRHNVNWLASDILQLLSVMQILTVGWGKRALFSKESQLPPSSIEPVWGAVAYGTIDSHMTIWKMTFYQDRLPVMSTGECRQWKGQLFTALASAARCLHHHTICNVRFFHTTSSCLSCVPLMHTHAHNVSRVRKYS